MGDLVDEFRKWEQTHNRENYGRYDAFKAGHDLVSAEIERLRIQNETLDALCSKSLNLEKDLLARIQELEAERDELNEAIHDARAALNAKSEDLVTDINWLKEERDELEAEREQILTHLSEVKASLGQSYEDFRKVNARAVELEATCAAQREALNLLLAHPFCECGQENCEGCAQDSMVRVQAGEALAPEAGMALLERVRRLERVADLLRDHLAAGLVREVGVLLDALAALGEEKK
jgi:chromosome segregation ATPase